MLSLVTLTKFNDAKLIGINKMSKRFGRNQRRKLAIENKSIKKELVDLKSMLKSVSNRNKQLEQIMDDTRRVLGNYFCTFDPTVVSCNNDVYNYYNISKDYESLQYENNLNDYQKLSFDIQTLAVMKPVVIKKLKGITHIKLAYGNNNFGYAISDEMIRYMPRDILIEKISCEIARTMVDYFHINQ